MVRPACRVADKAHGQPHSDDLTVLSDVTLVEDDAILLAGYQRVPAGEVLTQVFRMREALETPCEQFLPWPARDLHKPIIHVQERPPGATRAIPTAAF